MEKREISREEIQSELINDIMFHSKLLDELWSYHPDNLDRIDVVDEFENVQGILSSLEAEMSYDSELTGE